MEYMAFLKGKAIHIALVFALTMPGFKPEESRVIYTRTRHVVDRRVGNLARADV